MSFIKHAPWPWRSVWATRPPRPRRCHAAAKKQAIEREIAYARETDNTQRLRSLERALSASQDCNDAQLQRERKDKVRATKVKDIAKAQRKLDEARHELQQGAGRGLSLKPTPSRLL